MLVDVIESVSRGEALMSIARRLNDAGRPSLRGAKWSMRTVRRVALNQGYIGLRGHNGHTTEGIWRRWWTPPSSTGLGASFSTRSAATHGRQG